MRMQSPRRKGIHLFNIWHADHVSLRKAVEREQGLGMNTILTVWAAALACASCCWSMLEASSEEARDADCEPTLMSTSLMLPRRSPRVTTLHMQGGHVRSDL